MASHITSLCVTGVDARLLRARVSAFVCDPHLHNTYTIGLMRRGTTCFEVRGRRFLADPGDAFLIHPFEVHAGGDALQGIEYDVLYPTAELMAEAAQMRLSGNEFPFFDAVVMKRCEALERLFEAVDDCRPDRSSKHSDAGVEEAIKRAFWKRAYKSKTSCLPRRDILAVEAACELMQSFYHSPIDVAELGDRVGMSRYHFIRVFHRATGLTPSAFLRQVRLSRARDLIASGGELADIAADTGFADQAHMTREFRKTYGFTPGQLLRGIRQVRESRT